MKKLIILTLASLFSLSLAAQTLTLMSYNIRTSSANEYDGPNGWELRKAASVKMLRAERPDVVGMQEARPDQDAFSVTICRISTTEYLSAAILTIQSMRLVPCGITNRSSISSAQIRSGSARRLMSRRKDGTGCTTG